MTNNIQINHGLATHLKDLIAKMGFDNKRIILVSDEAIFHNCAVFFGANLHEVCSDKLILQNPKADEKNLQHVLKASLECDVIVALGSGTISDLCKLASAKQKIPYVIFPSAPSMNGYLSKNASITIKGHKKTVPATLPMAVFCDLDILKSAPDNLVKAGIGDSLCFYSCWFDWYLSHALLGTYFDESLFTMLEDKMEILVTQYASFALHDDALLRLLIEILLLSGQSMTKAGGSYPASQSEHLIAHVLDMKYPEKMKDSLHGQQIAVTTLISADLQEKLLKKKTPPAFIEHNDVEKKLMAYFGQEVAGECVKEFLQKKASIEKALPQIEWDKHHAKLSAILLKKEALQKIFNHFNIDDACEAFSLSKPQFQEAVSYARYIRNRATCLDVQ